MPSRSAPTAELRAFLRGSLRRGSMVAKRAARDNLSYLARVRGPVAAFHSDAYLRLNHRRQEHLATLGLALENRTVLEVGAGIGDHTAFFLDRGARVTITDGRAKHVALVARRFPDQEARVLDLEQPDPTVPDHDVVYCYGLLYHLSDPAAAIGYLAARCREAMLVETCVSPGPGEALNPTREARWNPTQATAGGCRPTRLWVWNRLAESFPHVYATTTQPWHEEFPTDWTAWTASASAATLTRAVFVASRRPLELPSLTTELPVVQARR